MADDDFSPYGKGEHKAPRAKDDRPGAHLDSMVAREQLRSTVERIERLEEEKSAIGDDIKEVYAEAKANGFDTKILKQVIRLRKMDLAERQEQDAIRDLYLQALGMLPDTGSA